MRPAHFVVQDVIARDHDPRSAAAALGADITILTGDPRGADLIALEQEIVRKNARPIVFCGLQVAGWIRRHLPTLATGIDLSDRFLRHSCYTSLLAPEWLLNPEGLYLPWGQIPRKMETIQSICGHRVFLRPDSSLKPFPGFDTALDDLAEEHRLRTATDRVDLEEMCYLAPARVLPVQEYRTWIIDSEVITSARYSWDAAEMMRHSTVPPCVLERAASLAAELAMREQCFTADFLLCDDTPCLVELNALSTSGWYPDADILSVFRAADRMFI